MDEYSFNKYLTTNIAVTIKIHQWSKSVAAVLQKFMCCYMGTLQSKLHDRDCLWRGRETKLRWILGGEASMLSVTFSNFIFQKN